MRELIKKALTRRITRRGPRGRKRVIIVEPSERLILAMKFSIVMSVCLCAVQAIHVAVTGKISNEIFAAITGLIGTISGIMLANKG